MKFIIADASGTMADILYNDIYKNDCFIIINKEKLNRVVRFFLSYRFRRTLLFWPFKKSIYKRLFLKYARDEELCFYFGIFWFDKKLFRMVKKKYPNCKMVFNFHDVVETKIVLFPELSIDELKTTFDLIYTYNLLDAKRYGFLYIPDMYSKFDISDLHLFPHYDVVFVGAAKNRLSKIIEIRDLLNAYGLKCWFYIVVPNANVTTQSRPDVIYSTKYLSFKEVIGRQISSDYILEITQDGCEDSTLRFWDAVMYNKRIITNCLAVKKYKYYNPNFVCCFEKPSDIKKTFFNPNILVDFHYNDDISPVSIFKKIENDLKENDNK